MIRPLRRTQAAVFSLVLSLLAASAAAGQRTFVSGTGSDTNAVSGCPLVLPCRSFGAALGQTIAGGEIIVLDSAGYGPTTIAQAVSIVAPPGVYAGVTVSSGDGITINAGPNDRIVLRGLVVNGLPAALHGIVVNSGGAVDLGRVEVAGFSASGIRFNGGKRLAVRDSIVRDNGAEALAFVPASPALLTVEGSSFDRSNVGVAVVGPSSASIVKSSASENLAGGIVASAGAVVVVADTRVTKTPDPVSYGGIWAMDAGTQMQLARCAVSGYGYAYYALGGGQMQVVDSTATGVPNGAGIVAQGGGSSVDVERSGMNRFVIGFYTESGGTIRVSASTATAVGTSFGNFGGAIATRQNNMSASGTSGSITPLPPI